MESITLVANASAGSSNRSAVAEAVSVLSEHAAVTVRETDGTDELRSALDAAADLVVVAGGDGSLHAAVAALDHLGRLSDVVVALVPLGTGNDFARTLGLPLEAPAAAARVAVEGVRRGLDLLRDDAGGVVVNAVHVGVGAEAARAAKPWKDRLGPLGYTVGALVAGLTTGGQLVRVTSDGRVLADGTRKVLQVAVANGVYIGAGTPLAPDADPGDGKADVVVSFAVPPLRRLGYAVRIKLGSHTERSDVVTARTGGVSIEGHHLWLNGDGELTGPIDRRRWHVDPGALSFMAPAGPR